MITRSILLRCSTESYSLSPLVAIVISVFGVGHLDEPVLFIGLQKLFKYGQGYMVRRQTMPPIITLYDVPSTAAEPWAPNIWRIR